MDALNRTDFMILEVLDNRERNIAANIAHEIDSDRGYLNSRFSTLRNEGLVRRVGPSKQSGLYEITKKGLVAVNHKEEYLNNEVDDFEAFIESKLDKMQDT